MNIQRIDPDKWPGRSGRGRWSGPGLAARLAFWEEVKAAATGSCWEVPAGSVEFPGTARSAQQWLTARARKEAVVIQTTRTADAVYVRKA